MIIQIPQLFIGHRQGSLLHLLCFHHFSPKINKMKAYQLTPLFYRITLSLLSMFLLHLSCHLSAQSIIPNGGFEQWETRTLYQEFPPYGTTNPFVYLAGSDFPPNATPVNGCTGSQALRIENIQVGQDVQIGALVIGSIGSQSYGGIHYTDQPDSLFLTLRYDFAGGEDGIIGFFFTTSDTTPAATLIQTISGSQPSCTTIGFDIPSFSAMPDSLAIIITSGDFNSPVVGSWVEIDSMYFSDNNAALPNSGFEITTPLEVREPVGWTSANDIQAILAGGAPMVEEELSPSHVYEGMSALRVTSRLISSDSNVIGVIVNGRSLLGDADGGQPYTGNLEDVLSGQYRYTPVGNDTGMVFLRFFSYEPIGDSTIIHLETGIPLLPTGIGYECFEVPYTLSQMPDSFLIGFGSSDVDRIFSAAEPGVGSSLLIDIIDFRSCPTTSIEPLWSELDVQIFPNPTADWLHLRYPSIPGERYHLRLLSLDGTPVYQQHIEPSFNSDQTELDISLQHFASGYYVLALTDEEGHLLFSKKIIKQ